jgi:DNA-binding winged helix-turn-helix (wHTH) protein/predicted ATPase
LNLSADILRFDDFELDRGTYQLRRGGKVVHLERIPLDVLFLLASQRDQLVTREEIRERIWGKGVFVDTANSINAAIGKIRRALGDDAEAPRFIATVPVRGYRFIATAYEASAGSLRNRPSQLSLIGRENEMASLRAVLEEAASGRGSIFLIHGEPGIGKTRITEVLTSQAQANRIAAFAGQCVEQDETVPYLPFVEMLENWVDTCTTTDAVREMVGAEGPELARLLPKLKRILPDLPAPLELAAAQARRHLFNCFCDFVARLVRAHPILMILDDLHWADESTLSLLEHLSQRIALLPLMVVATYRDAESNVSNAFGRTLENLSRSRVAGSFRLKRLSEEGVGLMLASLSGQTPPPAIVTEFYGETGGNPFFVGEMFRHLGEEGRLYDADGKFRTELGIAEHEVPPSVKLIVSRRVGRLSELTQEMLAAAAVIGRSFTVAVLASVGTADWLSAGIEEAGKAGLISSRPGDPRCEFSHELIRQAVLNGIPTARLRQLHLTVAGAVERIYENDAEEHASELAHHYRFGGDMAKAIDYLVLAARQAVVRKAFSEAIAQLRAGLTLLDGITAQSERSRLELALRTVLGLQLLGEGPGVPGVETNLARARNLCKQLKVTAEIVPILTGLRTYYRFRLELGKAREVAEELLAAVRAHDPSMLVAAYYALGDIHLFRGEFDLALEYFTRSMALPEAYQKNGWVGTAPGAAPLITTLFASCVLTYWALGYPEQALAFNQKAFACAREQKIDTTPLFHALSFSVRFNQWLRDSRTTREQAEELFALATQHGMPFYRALAVACRGWALAEEGNTELGIEEMQRASSALEEAGVAARSLEAAPLIEFYAKTGQVESGLTILTRALRQVEKTDERVCQAELYRLKGELLLQQNPADREEAEGAFRLAMETARRQSAKSWELRAATSLARLLSTKGESEGARAVLSETYAWFSEGFETADLKEAKAILDQLTEADSRNPGRLKGHRLE